MDVAAILGPDGPIAGRLDRYEERPEQTRVAEAVQSAFAAPRHLIVEAGTGVGKSFAYLLPAIEAACDGFRPVVLSTHTISLQEQLIGKDIPFLQAVLPEEFSAVLVKGRSNYVCPRRLSQTVQAGEPLFSSLDLVDEVSRIRAWAEVTEDGSLSDLGFKPTPDVWGKVCAEAGNCMGRHCLQYDRCHFQRARRRVYNADLLVVNHSLLFVDLVLRQEGANLLPDYERLVLDEAHTAEGVASDHLGLRVSEPSVYYTLNQLFSRNGRGILAAHGSEEAQRRTDEARAATAETFDRIRSWLKEEAPENGRVSGHHFMEQRLARALADLSLTVRRCAETHKDREVALELTARSARLLDLSSSVQSFFDVEDPDSVYWVDKERGDRLALRSAPVDVGSRLSSLLFDETDSVILTSASLSVGRPNSFDYLRNRVGLVTGSELVVGSPFDFVRQARIILPKDIPDPRSGEIYEKALARAVDRFVRRTEGGAFVLFTSYSTMDRVHDRVTPLLEVDGYRVLRQGGDLHRTAMVEAFKTEKKAVLFGTDSFWQGVDVPGDALRNVIITRLPFAVPTRPLVQARMETIQKRGGSSFREMSLPDAVLKLKQGFGRLIRHREDEGIVVILDNRITTKSYGRTFLESLPECTIERE
jgi:ATP-dependent DNA helicase DinG